MRCVRFVRENAKAIAEAQPSIPESLNDRAAEIWEPLLAIADLAGEEWPELASQAALRLSAGDEEMTLLEHFHKELRELFLARQRPDVQPRQYKGLNPMHSQPWKNLTHARELNEWRLALARLEMRSRYLRLKGSGQEGIRAGGHQNSISTVCCRPGRERRTGRSERGKQALILNEKSAGCQDAGGE
jgi:hypothetical protein